MKLNLTAIILPQRLSVNLYTGKASSTEFPDINIVYCLHNSGAPNENIVQNHLNMALLNVF